MYQVLLVILLLVAVSLVGLILLQQGKGADMGASFGAGASATLFGAGGSGNFMTRMTAILASLFFIISLVLGNMAGNKSNGNQWQNLSDSSVTAPVVAPAPTASDAATVKPNSDIPK